jgi:nucleotide-binding universal stress UspA family protein
MQKKSSLALNHRPRPTLPHPCPHPPQYYLPKHKHHPIISLNTTKGPTVIKNILVGIDGSPHSQTACDYALYLALRLTARLEAIHIVDTRPLDLLLLPTPAPTPLITWSPAALESLRQSLRTRGEKLLQQTATRCEQAGLPITTTLQFGHPPQVLADIQSRTELIILGRQGQQTQPTPDPTGSTMDRFIRRALRPCLVTPATFRPIQKLLTAVDGSASATRALHIAVELANALAVPLVILSIAERPTHLPDAQRNAIEAHTLARAHDCAAATLTATGAPGNAILEKAKETAADLIVLGAHGHGWVYDRLIGSAAAHVLTHSPHPVLLAR